MRIYSEFEKFSKNKLAKISYNGARQTKKTMMGISIKMSTCR
jgi:hypothetical protein